MLKLIEPVLPRTASNPASAPLPASLPVGSVFAVEAVRDSATGQMLLLLAGRRFALKPGGAAAELVPGQKVDVRVVGNEPELELALVGRPDAIASALRRELPQQASPLRLLANLAWLAQRAGQETHDWPAAAREAVATTWRAVPEAAALASPDGLEQACRNSGLQLEHRLAHAVPAELATLLRADWKAGLCRLRDALARSGGTRIAGTREQEPAPVPAKHAPLHAMAREPATLATLATAADPQRLLGELAQQAHEAIARVTCNQLASLDGHAQTGFPVLLEIPYRDGEDAGLLRLRIDHDGDAGSERPVPAWSVDFALELGDLGPLRGRVTLAASHVSVTFKPESSALAQAIDAHVGELRESMQADGVPVGLLSCTRSDPVPAGPTGAWLVNVRA